MFHVIQFWPIKICLKFLPKRKVIIGVVLPKTSTVTIWNTLGLSWFMRSQEGCLQWTFRAWGRLTTNRRADWLVSRLVIIIIIIISFEMRFVMFHENRLLRDKFPGTSWYRKYMVDYGSIILSDWYFTTILPKVSMSSVQMAWIRKSCKALGHCNLNVLATC